MGNQGNCSRDRSRCLFAGEGLSEQSPVPGSMGECPLLDTQGNAGSAGRSPAGGKAGRTATCKHALGAKRHQAWSSKDVFIFPSGKSKMSNAAHRLPGRVSPPSLSSCQRTLNVMASAQRSNTRPRLKGRDEASVL